MRAIRTSAEELKYCFPPKGERKEVEMVETAVYYELAMEVDMGRGTGKGESISIYCTFECKYAFGGLFRKTYT